MLTVKISVTDNGVRGHSETIFEASQVRKEGDDVIVDHAEGGSSTWSVNRQQQIETFMYVVNRNGATVATYRL